MSHDRGCYCGRERYEYEDCPRLDCHKKPKKAQTMPKKPKSYVVTKQTSSPIYHTKSHAIQVAKNFAEMYPGEVFHIAEVKENYTYEEPKKKGKFTRRYYKPKEDEHE